MKINKLKVFAKSNYLKLSGALLANPEGLRFQLIKAKKKLSRKSVQLALGDTTHKLRSFIRMVMLWAKGDYREVSKKTITYTVLAILYFLSPVDFVPDILSGVGLLDDITVVKWVYDYIKQDIEEFEQWEDSQQSMGTTDITV